MTTGGSPTVRRRILASELRRLRVAADMTQQQAEAVAGLGHGAVSRYESCVSSVSVPVCTALLGAYKLEDDEKRAVLLELAKGGRRRGWLREWKGIIPEWLEDLVALERDAAAMQELALHFVPGLMQTERYARAVLQAGIVGLDVESHLRARLARAAVLDRDPAPEYWVVLCEPVLHLQVGGREVLAEQLTHLAELAQRPNITVQVLPYTAGAHPSMTTPYVVLEFGALAPDLGVVYLDYLTGSLYRDEPAEVDQYQRAFRHLIKTALSESQSLDLITKRAQDLMP